MPEKERKTDREVINKKIIKNGRFALNLHEDILSAL